MNSRRRKATEGVLSCGAAEQHRTVSVERGTGGAPLRERQVQLYDTTLRDGMQQEGMSVSVDEKVRIALKLDELGIGFIEGGFPASNPKEIEFFRRMKLRAASKHARIAAFGMTRRKGAPPEADHSMRVLAEIFTPTVAVVGKTWGLHLRRSCA